MITALINSFLAYLLGSVSGSLMLGALRNVDIRLVGSGNAGGTNAFRTQGLRFALAVVAIDVTKGVLATAVLSRIHLPGLEQSIPLQTQMVLCGFAAVVGHCFPIWHGFKGGKGAATAIGVLFVIQPMAVVPMLLCWLLVLTVTGWVGLATMITGFSMVPIFLWLEVSGVELDFAWVMALFLVFTHRDNIRKMRSGAEYRFEKAMIRRLFR